MKKTKESVSKEHLLRINCYTSKNMKIILMPIMAFLMVSSAQAKQDLVVTINGGKVFLNSEPVVDLEKELKSISCSNKTKLKLQSKQGVPYKVLEKVMKQISNAGCMKQLELEQI